MRLIPKHSFDFGTTDNGQRLAWADSRQAVESCCRNVRQLSQRRGVTGYYADPYYEQLFSAHTGQLPAARDGSLRFVAIVEDVDCGCFFIELATWDDEIGAWNRALQLAERMAEAQGVANCESLEELAQE